MSRGGGRGVLGSGGVLMYEQSPWRIGDMLKGRYRSAKFEVSRGAVRRRDKMRAVGGEFPVSVRPDSLRLARRSRPVVMSASHATI